MEFPFPFYIVIRQPLSFEPFFSPSQEKRKRERWRRGRRHKEEEEEKRGRGRRRRRDRERAWPHLCVAGFFCEQ